MKNQILITIDSLRWDVFKDTPNLWLKSHPFAPCWTHGTYTLPAHQSMFIGKVPHNFSGKEHFDTCGVSGRPDRCKLAQWRLLDGTSQKKGRVVLEGKTIADGFSNLGWQTIGTGAMKWFDPRQAATFSLLTGFQKYQYFRTAQDDGTNIVAQVDWLIEQAAQADQAGRQFFMFLNIGETHHPYVAAGHDLRGDWHQPAACRAAQTASLRWVDTHIQRLFEALRQPVFALVCSDHGDCWGEDDLWGHGFYHPMIMKVPLVTVNR